jgi:ABC-type multidrug transport system fused ATPase/permease subunit|tara:strand:- start:49 stop:1665 length:1617 start_codon:yes stop_codon:yes gene_type:complete
MIDNLKTFYDDLIKVSKLTKTNNKKLRIFSLAIILNLLVFFDIMIILYFSVIFSQEIQFDNLVIRYFLDNYFYLPIFILFRFSFIYLEKIITTRLQIDIEKNLRTHLLEEVFTRGNVSISDAYYYVNTLSAQVGGFYSTLATFFGSFLQIIVFSIYLLLSNFQAVATFAVGSIILFLPTLYLTKLGRKYAHIAYESGQQISLDLEKVLDNLFLIKILKYVQKEVFNFKQSLETFYKSRLNDIKAGTANTLMPNFFTLFVLSILLVFFDFLKYLTFDFIGILLRLFQSLGLFNKNIHTVSAFHVYLEKLYEVEKNKEIISSDNFSINEGLDKDVSLVINNLTFQYLGTDELMFDNLNLVIPRNKHTIITGPNGSGKSTLLGLMSGIFYPTKGLVQSYTNRYGYVSATPMILNDTLRNNILYGNQEDITDDEIINFIKQFKLFGDEADIELSQKISNKKLSTGQMQKISFIRALLSNPEILILDESTSNLDLESRKLIFDIINNQNLTIINSTHSPESFIGYDHHISIYLDENIRKIKIH